MKHITSTALAAGAQEICAESAERSLPGMGSITLQPAFRPISRRDIMAAVNTCSRDLGIRQGAVVVLDALLSCLPCQGVDGRETPVSPTTLLTVYASNETLCFRARGLTDRQLRRHLETLETAGLIRRRDSANGKRFPVMQHGKPIGAFGLDLSPLFAQSDELLALALRRREEADELRGLRAQILRLRAACAELQLSDAVATFIDGLRNLVRRISLTLIEAREALSQLTAVLSSHAAPQAVVHYEVEEVEQRLPSNAEAANTISCAETTMDRAPDRAVPKTFQALTAETCGLPPTEQKPASDGRNVRHIEQDSDTKKRKRKDATLPSWAALAEVSAFYAEPTSAQEATRIAFEFGKMLRISQDILASAASKLGLWELLSLENRMAKQIGTIINPDAYVRSVLRV
ncbi:helix-turn-helix domain-containing protein [Paenirhodobacter populi]|uniref:Replication protein C n=1 Tax=Paenirhodobacter populi TaxID=2306993 RepID=A0A443JRA0_9RHOB|nr:helix-turn-helix domain-containing protein [Sinirhodobacter populi]RWR23044.1 replication protein C [Sinirhodobacter populi]